MRYMAIISSILTAAWIGLAGDSGSTDPVDPLAKKLLETVDAKQLRRWHDMAAAEPHVAGTPGDLRLVDNLAKAFADMGLEVEKRPFWAYLPRPGEASVEIVAPEKIVLPLREEDLEEDPYDGDGRLTVGWNAYSGSGDVVAEVVYVRHGTKADFEELAKLGVSCRGKIAIARYGRNFRGYKAKFAQEAGALGLIIYTDPRDSGFARGLPYPEGGYANATYIQRGSIKTLPYDGDPLTPFVEATEDAERLDPDEVGLPRIPVQPIGWRAAEQILSRMRGTAAPQDWQGGLPFRYRLEGGSGLKVRLLVSQPRQLVKTYNVVGVLRGSRWPEQHIILGSHHDAWNHGASDPTAGLITVLEAARAYSEAAKAGLRPLRSIAFAGWGAEEQGIIGSVEWVEGKRDDLRRNLVAYVNLDMAAMGPYFGSSSSPALQPVIAAAARRTPQARNPEQTVFEQWFARGTHASDASLPRFGDLGGGSDHVGFLALIGASCAGMGGGGSPGTAYHSNYDNLAWYRKVVGEDYEPAVMATRMAALTAAELAARPLLPLDFARVGVETRRHLDYLAQIGRENGFFDGSADGDMVPQLARIDAAALHFHHRAIQAQQSLAAAYDAGRLDDAALARVNRLILDMDRAWLHADGVPERPWFQNLYAATDMDSGYAPWMLPALRYAVDRRDAAALERIEPLYLAVFERLLAAVGEIKNLAGGQP